MTMTLRWSIQCYDDKEDVPCLVCLTTTIHLLNKAKWVGLLTLYHNQNGFVQWFDA